MTSKVKYREEKGREKEQASAIGRLSLITRQMNSYPRSLQLFAYSQSNAMRLELFSHYLLKVSGVSGAT